MLEDEAPEAVLSWTGESRDYFESGADLCISFAIALVVVFLVLAAQFESCVNPVVILTTVPLAVFGALLGLLLQGLSINIYSQIGVIMPIGLAARNGILIVEFANQRRGVGSARDAGRGGLLGRALRGRADALRRARALRATRCSRSTPACRDARRSASRARRPRRAPPRMASTETQLYGRYAVLVS